MLPRQPEQLRHAEPWLQGPVDGLSLRHILAQSGRVMAGWAVYSVPSFCTVRVAGLANTLSSVPPMSGTCQHQPPDAPGDYNQALMELGALVCVPNGAPLCEKGPLAHLCAARAAGTALEPVSYTHLGGVTITRVEIAREGLAKPRGRYFLSLIHIYKQYDLFFREEFSL